MTTPTIQICIDAADPHLLNRFWAAATGYEMEDHHDGILGIVDAGYATLEEDTIEIDGRLAWKIAAACYDPSGTGPRLLFQQVPEAKTVKDRVHLDLQRQLDAGRSRSRGRAVDRPRCRAPLGRRAGSAPVGHDGRPRGQRVLRELTGAFSGP